MEILSNENFYNQENITNLKYRNIIESKLYDR